MALLSRVAAFAIAVTANALLGAVSSSAAPSEDDLKAAYLFNFARYVTWPAEAFDSSDSPLRICVAGQNGFLKVLSATVAGKQVEGRSVTAEPRDDADQAVDCHILYLDAESAEAVAGLREHSVFTVSGAPGFAADGGIANFLKLGRKVRFEINVSAAQRAGLEVSSRLLRLAQVVP